MQPDMPIRFKELEKIVSIYCACAMPDGISVSSGKSLSWFWHHLLMEVE